MRRTKILATLGPASREPAVLQAMIEAGLDAVRLNFSHGTQEEHAATYRLVREIAARVGKPIAVLQDLQGPKIRIGRVRGQMQVPTGSRLVITARPIEGADGVVSTDYPGLLRDLRAGDRVLLDEGRIALRVREVGDDELVADVEHGGVLSSHKGINVPGAALTAAAMTPKDEADVRFGLELGVDFVALSFVRRAEDVASLRSLMRAAGRVVPIVAKIEKPQALDALEAIAAASDGLMVARGDLGIEVPLETMPAHQKRIIQQGNQARKLVVTATQMLESMTTSPMPTRAEVTDVANAVLDGTDAVMLSGETAVGMFPVETVRRMAAIVEAAEESLYPFHHPVSGDTHVPGGADHFVLALARLAGRASCEVQAKAIVVFTRSGRSATAVTDERPRAPIVALCPSDEVRRRLALEWGVLPRPMPDRTSMRDMIAYAEAALRAEGIAASGDPVVFMLGAALDPDAAHSVRIARLPMP